MSSLRSMKYKKVNNKTVEGDRKLYDDILTIDGAGQLGQDIVSDDIEAIIDYTVDQNGVLNGPVHMGGVCNLDVVRLYRWLTGPNRNFYNTGNSTKCHFEVEANFLDGQIHGNHNLWISIHSDSENGIDNNHILIALEQSLYAYGSKECCLRFDFDGMLLSFASVIEQKSMVLTPRLRPEYFLPLTVPILSSPSSTFSSTFTTDTTTINYLGIDAFLDLHPKLSPNSKWEDKLIEAELWCHKIYISQDF